jgi:transcriptional regulator with XRE-family HTH domain
MNFQGLLRVHRERLTPEVAGLPAGCSGGRRTPGLRRGELAGLAGVSENHLIRLEQGRRSPSTGVVDALARALRLTPVEHGKLRAAAGFAAPPTPTRAVPREITPPARRLLDRLTQVPACVCDATWSVLEGNRQWNAYGCGAASAHGRARNMAWRTFIGMPTDLVRPAVGWNAFRAALVTDLRTAVDRYRGDADLSGLVAELRRVSVDFARLWDDPHTAGHDGDPVRVPHPVHGHVALDKDVLTIDDGDLRVVMFTLASEDADVARVPCGPC